jgi:hypothetical protein
MKRRCLCWLQDLLYINNTKKVKIPIAYLFAYSVCVYSVCGCTYVYMFICMSGINVYGSHLVVFVTKYNTLIYSNKRFIMIQIIVFTRVLHVLACT